MELKRFSTKSFDSLEREKREGHRQSYIIGWDITNNELIRRSVFGRPDKALETVISWLDNDDIKYRYLKSFTDSSEANEYAEELKSKMSKSFSSKKEFSDDLKEVIFKTRNPELLTKIVNTIGELGNPGHTFTIVLDPGSDSETKFTWDGDGSDYIELDSIKSFSEREQVPQYIADEVDASGVVVKYKGDWRIVSKKTTPYEFWDAKYKTKQDAEDALAAYHANK